MVSWYSGSYALATTGRRAGSAARWARTGISRALGCSHGRRVASASLIASVLVMSGCASLQLQQYAWTEKVIERTPREDTLGRVEPNFNQDGADLTVTVAPLCKTVEVEQVSRIGMAEYGNATPGRDWAWGIVGAATAAGGGFFFVDYALTYERDATAQHYNERGRSVPLGLGIAGVNLTPLRGQFHYAAFALICLSNSNSIGLT